MTVARLRAFLAVTAAFVRRDFLFQWSYKFGSLYEVGTLFASVLTLFFVGRTVGETPPRALEAYGTDYFTFTLIGIAFLDYMYVSMRTFAQHVRMAQFMGTLEAMMMTPTSPFAIIVASAAYTYLWTILRSVLYLVFGALVFGAAFGAVNGVSVLLFVVLIVLAFSALGLLSAALTLYLKQADPFTGLIGGISFLFGGIVYPVQSLPGWMQDVAWLLPMTHAAEGLRQAFLNGRTPADLWQHAAVLAAWALIAFPVSAWTLRRVLAILSREGSFSAY